MTLFKGLALVMIVATMFGSGLQVDRHRFAETLRHYGLIGKAMLANFVLVPLFATLLVRIFHVEGGIAIGIVLMSMAPGVPFLPNSAGRSGGGSLSFALTIAFCFAALSVLTIPATIDLLLPPAAAAQIPIRSFLTTLILFQLVPLVAGAAIGPRLPAELTAKAVKALHATFLVAALGLVVLLFPRILSSISTVFGFGHLAIIAAVGIFSAGVGWLLGGPDVRYRRTLSIATMLRNIGLCALIGTGPAFANTTVVPTILTYLIVTVILTLPLRAYYQRTKAKAAA